MPTTQGTIRPSRYFLLLEGASFPGEAAPTGQRERNSAARILREPHHEQQDGDDNVGVHPALDHGEMDKVEGDIGAVGGNVVRVRTTEKRETRGGNPGREKLRFGRGSTTYKLQRRATRIR
jgi:hypothetical protein